ncbi:hypothetical protein FNU76_19740 [Chitinimonas arctica]|uniref:Uncharacterized protein n=1 Tax=Chitinimonas arctica TaxID=2594795 RepID=A0A516SJT2_9NEIS|nr:hypothetical protein [Chitinimonas arctica]QDQ28407.1 hypothetical protein FNU76_19740 [Chitinimonas arctica]
MHTLLRPSRPAPSRSERFISGINDFFERGCSFTTRASKITEALTAKKAVEDAIAHSVTFAQNPTLPGSNLIHYIDSDLLARHWNKTQQTSNCKPGKITYEQTADTRAMPYLVSAKCPYELITVLDNYKLKDDKLTPEQTALIPTVVLKNTLKIAEQRNWTSTEAFDTIIKPTLDEIKTKTALNLPPFATAGWYTNAQGQVRCMGFYYGEVQVKVENPKHRNSPLTVSSNPEGEQPELAFFELSVKKGDHLHIGIKDKVNAIYACPNPKTSWWKFWA